MQVGKKNNQITINGMKLSYTETNGSKPAIILLHGWTCNRTFWNKQLELFTDKRKAVAIDFRGHGESQITSEGNTIQQLADDVYAFIEKMGFEKVVLIGHSMGGMVAQLLCSEHIECLEALILVTTIAADLKNKLISKQIESDTPIYGYRDAFLKNYIGWLNPEADSKIVEWTKDQMLKTPESVANSLVRSYRTFDLRSCLPKIKIPCLVVGAGSDASAVPEEAKTLASLIPEAQLVMIDKCGHFPMLEQPERLNQELNRFLSFLS
jgi:pimeloyl-ACP methyl ester carboxylesterase